MAGDSIHDLRITPMRAAIRRGSAVAVLIVSVAGCSALPGQRAAEAIPPVELRLLSAGALDLPSDCEPASGAVYRATYLVGQDGRVGDVRAESAPACVRNALVEWVAGFRYAPPGAPVPATIDWMAVVAQRGG
jgi:hypothetical protein